MQSNHLSKNALIESLDLIEKELANDPRNEELLARAIDGYLAAGKLEDARRHVDAAILYFPDNPYFAHRKGQVFLAIGNLTAAEKIFAQLFQETPEANIGFNLANVYFLQGRYADVCDLLAPMVTRPWRPEGVVTLMLRALHRKGDVKSGIELLQSNLTSCANEPDFLGTASLLLFDDGQLEQARQTSVAALVASDGHSLEALVVSASLALGEGDFVTAEAQFNAALKICASDGRSWAGLGMISLGKHDLNLAARQLERAIGYMPDHIGTRHLLGWCKIFDKDLDAADQIFLQALSMDRNFGESHGGLAVVAALRGDRESAEERIRRANGLDAKSLSARYAQMILSGKTGDFMRIRELAMKALSARSNSFAASLLQGKTRES